MKFKNSVRRLVLSSLFCFMNAFVMGAHANVILDIDPSGELMGATGIDLGTFGFYDVSFNDGSCIGLFSGCHNANFEFHNVHDAGVASQALYDQVFHLGLGFDQFVSSPRLTNGCSDLSACRIATPLSTFSNIVNISVFENSQTPQKVYVQMFLVDYDMARETRYVYAQWSKETSQVPEPTSSALFGLAVLGLGWAQRRRQTANNGNT